MVLAINRAKAQFNNLHLNVFKNESVVVVIPMHNDCCLRQHWVKMCRCLCRTTILDKTVEEIVYLDSIFLNIVAVPVFPSPPSPESNVVVYSKETLIPGRLWEATLNWGKGVSFRKGVVLEIVLLRRKVDVMGKTFSSSFVRDCRWLIVKSSCRFELLNYRITPNLRSTVYSLGVKDADEATWNKVFDKYLKEPVPSEKRKLMYAVTNIRNKKILQK